MKGDLVAHDIRIGKPEPGKTQVTRGVPEPVTTAAGRHVVIWRSHKPAVRFALLRGKLIREFRDAR